MEEDWTYHECRKPSRSSRHFRDACVAGPREHPSYLGRNAAISVGEGRGPFARPRRILDIIADPPESDWKGCKQPIDRRGARPLRVFGAAALRIAEEAFLQHRDGHLTEDYWETRANNLLYRMRAPALRSNWHEWRKRHMLTSEFSQWLDRELATLYGPDRPLAEKEPRLKRDRLLVVD